MEKNALFLLVLCILLQGCLTPEEINVGKDVALNDSVSRVDVCASADDSNERDVCYLNLSVSSKDASLCEKIQAQDAKDLCLAAATNSMEAYCDERVNKINKAYCMREDQKHNCNNTDTQQKNKDICLELGGALLGDIDLCSRISDEYIRLRCNAQASHDSSYCDKIDSELYKDDCYMRVGH